MTIEIRQFTDEKKFIKDFLKLPKVLYRKDENTEDLKTVRKLLLGRHPLNKYFLLHKFIAYSDHRIVARFVLTAYPNDHNAYIGFFESIDDDIVSREIFRKATDYAKQSGYRSIIGPVDASFWIKYRLKINNFDTQPYTGEPYNKSYYLKMFQDNVFKICDHYTSNQYKAAQYNYINTEYYNKYKEFKAKGYKIKSPKNTEFYECLSELYALITSLYNDFPVYKDLSKADFIEVFKSYQKIIDPSMIKFAYQGN